MARTKKILLILATALLAMPYTVHAEQETANDEYQAAFADTIDFDEGVGDSIPGASLQNDRIGEIEAGEEDKLQRRRKAKIFNAAGFGPAGLANMSSESVSYNLYYGVLWEVNPQAAIKAIGEASSDFADATLFTANLGANYYLLNNDISPYLGGDLGFGFGIGEDDNAFGFDVGTVIGVQLFRLTDTQMNIELHTQVLLSEVGDNFPVKYGARLGVLF